MGNYRQSYYPVNNYFYLYNNFLPWQPPQPMLSKEQTPLSAALALAKKGFHLFPTIGKVALVKDWPNVATDDTDQITAWSVKHPNCNFAIALGKSNHAVVDVDIRDGKDGTQTLVAWAKEHGKLPRTLTVRTPSGGWHIYFQGKLHNTQSKLGSGIDIKSHGGYVVAPGGYIDNKRYEVVSDADIAPVPAWLQKISEEAHAASEGPAIGEEGFIESGERNNLLTRLAGVNRRQGASEETILEILRAYNDNHCTPPTADRELQAIARSVARYPIEHADALLEFSAAIDKPIHAFDITQLAPKEIPPRQWIMEGVYIKGHLTVMCAPGGTGKSALSLLDGLAVLTGKPLSGFAVHRPGNVWWHNAEDPLDEMQRRLAALTIQYNIDPSTLHGGFFTSGREFPITLATTTSSGVLVIEEMVAKIKDFIRKNNITLFVADPFVRLHQCNENDNMAIDKVANALINIADSTSCAVLLIHHTSKAAYSTEADIESAGLSRGASALTNAARIANNLLRMTPAQAKALNIPESERKCYFQRANAKANLAAPLDHAIFYQTTGIPLPNGEVVGGVTLRTDIQERKVLAEQERVETEAKEWKALFTEAGLFQPTAPDIKVSTLRDLAISRLLTTEKAHHSRFREGLMKHALFFFPKALLDGHHFRRGPIKTDKTDNAKSSMDFLE